MNYKEHRQPNKAYDNTYLAGALATIGVEIARGPVACELRNFGLEKAVHWTTRLLLCIEEGRAEDPEGAQSKLRRLQRDMGEMLPKPPRGELAVAVSAAEQETRVTDQLMLCRTAFFRQRPWSRTSEVDASFIFRCLTALLRCQSPIASFSMFKNG